MLLEKYKILPSGCYCSYNISKMNTNGVFFIAPAVLNQPMTQQPTAGIPMKQKAGAQFVMPSFAVPQPGYNPALVPQIHNALLYPQTQHTIRHPEVTAELKADIIKDYHASQAAKKLKLDGLVDTVVQRTKEELVDSVLKRAKEELAKSSAEAVSSKKRLSEDDGDYAFESVARKQTCNFDGFSKLAQEPPFEVSCNQKIEKKTVEPNNDSNNPESFVKMFSSTVSELKSIMQDFVKTTVAMSANSNLNVNATVGTSETNEDSSFRDVKRQQTHKLQGKLEAPTPISQNCIKQPIENEVRNNDILSSLSACVVHQEK